MTGAQSAQKIHLLKTGKSTHLDTFSFTQAQIRLMRGEEMGNGNYWQLSKENVKAGKWNDTLRNADKACGKMWEYYHRALIFHFSLTPSLEVSNLKYRLQIVYIGNIAVVNLLRNLIWKPEIILYQILPWIWPKWVLCLVIKCPFMEQYGNNQNVPTAYGLDAMFH